MCNVSNSSRAMGITRRQTNGQPLLYSWTMSTDISFYFYKYNSLVFYYRRFFFFFQQEVSFSTLLEETWYEKSQLSKGHHLYSLYNGPAWICNSDLLKGCWLISHNSTLTHCSKSSPSRSPCSKFTTPVRHYLEGYSHVRKAPHRRWRADILHAV